ncbi:hypothetical protein DFH09DRAFT_1327342 [Mycena vulgaris]|nr:hypothetical protein DFH09DRAFT_1327342 [Mycena vulgaris]
MSRVDSLHLLASYLSAFAVQLYFVRGIDKLTKGRGKFDLSAIGIYTILMLAVVELPAEIAQTVLSYKLRSFLKLGETKPINTVQCAASLACDVFIAVYLCLTTLMGLDIINWMMDILIYEAINRGTLTAVASVVNMVLFLVLPDTFWFFLGLAPCSKLYMNSLFAMLNTRQRIRDNMAVDDKGWISIPMGSLLTSNIPNRTQGQASIAAIDFEAASIGKSSVIGVAV